MKYLSVNSEQWWAKNLAFWTLQNDSKDKILLESMFLAVFAACEKWSLQICDEIIDLCRTLFWWKMYRLTNCSFFLWEQ